MIKYQTFFPSSCKNSFGVHNTTNRTWGLNLFCRIMQISPQIQCRNCKICKSLQIRAWLLGYLCTHLLISVWYSTREVAEGQMWWQTFSSSTMSKQPSSFLLSFLPTSEGQSLKVAAECQWKTQVPSAFRKLADHLPRGQSGTMAPILVRAQGSGGSVAPLRSTRITIALTGWQSSVPLKVLWDSGIQAM